jgi:hypothetical protein
VPENVRPGPVLRLGVKKRFVIAGLVHGILEGFLEMPVKLAGGLKVFGYFERRERLDKFGPAGFVKNQPVGKNVTQRSSGTVNEGIPLIAGNNPVLLVDHPFLQFGPEAFVTDGLARKKLGREFDRPRDMTFESADEPFVQPHAPLGLLARNDFRKPAEEFFQPRLDVFFNLRTVHIGRFLQIKAKEVILHPAVGKRQIPFLPVIQDKLVDVPGEEELGAGVVGLGPGIFHQCRVVRAAAFAGARHLDFSGKD